VRFFFEHRERQRKKHFCLLRCLFAFATPIKFYFDVFFKLLPYAALAFDYTFFLPIIAHIAEDFLYGYGRIMFCYVVLKYGCFHFLSKYIFTLDI